MTYREALTEAMAQVADNRRAIFLGQGVAAPGTFMSATLRDVPSERRLELPVAEELQMGMTLGLALGGMVPVSLFPRWNFLLLAANQLVNHIDKIKSLPTLLIRVGVGSSEPLDPGPQHTSDFTDGFRALLTFTPVIKLDTVDRIAVAYRHAVDRGGPTVLVEFADYYDRET